MLSLENPNPTLLTPWLSALREKDTQGLLHKVYFLPTFSKHNHTPWAEEAACIVLQHSAPLAICSFQKMEALSVQDEYGVLKYAGTAFIRLPISYQDVVDVCQNSNAPQEQWVDYAIPTFKKLYEAKYRTMAHGSKTEFLSLVSGPLRAACSGAMSLPDRYLPSISEHLPKVQAVLKLPAIVALRNVLATSKNMLLEIDENRNHQTEKDYFKRKVVLHQSLDKLEHFAFQSAEDVKPLYDILSSISQLSV